MHLPTLTFGIVRVHARDHQDLLSPKNKIGPIVQAAPDLHAASDLHAVRNDIDKAHMPPAVPERKQAGSSTSLALALPARNKLSLPFPIVRMPTAVSKVW